MESISLNEYKINKICNDIKLKFGIIQSSEQILYSKYIKCMELNLMQIHHINPAIYTSRKALEAINYCLITLYSKITNISYNFCNYINSENEIFINILIQSYDCKENIDLLNALTNESINIEEYQNSANVLSVIIKCLLKLKDTIEYLLKKSGFNGYFLLLNDILNEEEYLYTSKPYYFIINNYK